MMRVAHTAGLALLAATLISSTALAAGTDLPGEYKGKSRVTFSTGYNYSMGSYGQAEDTNITYIPASAKVNFGRFAARLTVPYIRITGPGVVTGDGEVTDGAAGAVRTEEGLGDILTGLDYTWPINKNGTRLNFAGEVKLPTASTSKGLGTGGTDFTSSVGITQTYGDAFFNARVGRKFNGDSSTTVLRDVWKYSAGAGYKIDADWTVGANYNFRGAATESGENPESASGYVSYKVTDEVSAQLYAGGGFNHASPDFMTGVTLSYKFDPREVN